MDIEKVYFFDWHVVRMKPYRKKIYPMMQIGRLVGHIRQVSERGMEDFDWAEDTCRGSGVDVMQLVDPALF